MLEAIVSPETTVIPALGPSHRLMMDPLAVLRGTSFPAVQILPSIDPAVATAAGFERARGSSPAIRVFENWSRLWIRDSWSRALASRWPFPFFVNSASALLPLVAHAFPPALTVFAKSHSTRRLGRSGGNPGHFPAVGRVASQAVPGICVAGGAQVCRNCQNGADTIHLDPGERALPQPSPRSRTDADRRRTTPKRIFP
jgi:hypothetical protein